MERDIGTVEDHGETYIAKWHGEGFLSFSCASGDGCREMLYRGDAYHVDRQLEIGHTPYLDRFDHDRRLGARRLEIARSIFGDDAFDLVIDIGCANGGLVSAATAMGIESIGLDINREILEGAAYREPSLRGNLCEWDVGGGPPPENVSDRVRGRRIALFMNDTIEHFLEVRSSLGNISEMIDENSMMIVDTPDVDSDGYHELGLMWHHVRPKEHPFLYSERALVGVVGDVIPLLTLVATDRPIPGKMVLYFSGNKVHKEAG